MYNTFIGIDPGQNGGIAVIDSQGLAVRVLPFNERELDWKELQTWLEVLSMEVPGKIEPVAYIERVGAMPKQGVVSMWSFGYTTGQIHMFIRMLHTPMKLVTPQAWKKEILTGTDKSKDAARNYCINAYPNVRFLSSSRSTKIHDGMCDAACIAEYAMRKEK